MLEVRRRRARRPQPCVVISARGDAAAPGDVACGAPRARHPARDRLRAHRAQERTQEGGCGCDGLERENLRLRAALQEKSALISAAEGMIGQIRVQLTQAQEDAAKAMSQAACALALGQHGSGAR